MRKLVVLLFAGSSVLALAQVVTNSAPSPADVAAEQRARELVGRMTLEEKVSQMQNHAVAIPRLQIPAYDWWSEGLHGSARSGYSTLFPQAIGMAATWDAPLLHDEGVVVSTEARAKYEQALREDLHEIYYGLDIWSPNINIFRDPRWGRGQETLGEDPYLTSRLGVAFVRGLQGDDPTYYRTIATPKHFAVHSGPESTRHTANVDPSEHDFTDTYLPAFRATVTEGKADSVMCAYNSLFGEPACANARLLARTLREAWGFHGYVTSDCWAVTDISEGHKFAPDPEHAAADALRAGTDTSCGPEFSHLVKAVRDGLVKESEIDTAVTRLFTARVRLGMFDPPEKVAYARTPASELDSPAHRQMALRAAEEAMVLLKNDGTLPLAKSVKTVAVIGPNAASLAAIEGNYNAIPVSPVLPFSGMEQGLDARKVLYAQGSPYVAELGIVVPRTALHPAKGGAAEGLHAEYFNGTSFSGRPVLTRTDEQIDFDWTAAKPAPAVEMKQFGVRWTGVLAVPAAGDYAFDLSFENCYPCRDRETLKVMLDDRVVGEKTTEAAENRPVDGVHFTVHADGAAEHALRIEYTHNAPLFGAGLKMSWKPNIEAERAQAVAAAKQADVVVAFVGLSPDLEGEEMPVKIEGFAGGDRTAIELPAVQQQMLEAVAATGKPLVVVLMNGSAIASPWIAEHAAAVLEAWYPGEEGGTAIAHTLAGANNPAGRLPVTFYAATAQLPEFTDYSMKDRTYRYFAGKPLYAFGDGLSYTQFAYTGVRLSNSSLDAGEPLTVEADVKNTGARVGDEVAELYLTPPADGLAPRLALAGFTRVHLAPGESRQVRFTLTPRDLSVVDAQGKRAVRAGRYAIAVAGSQPGPSAARAELTITGTVELPR